MLGNRFKEEGVDVNGNECERTTKLKNVIRSDKNFVNIKNYFRVPAHLIKILETEASNNNIPPLPRKHDSLKVPILPSQPEGLAEGRSEAKSVPEKSSLKPPRGLAEKRLQKIHDEKHKLGNRSSFKLWGPKWNERKMPSPEECNLPIRHLMRSELPEVGKCLCQRPTRTVLCRFCGYHCQSNVKATCELHPKTFYLNNIDICPKCKAPNLLIELNLYH